MRKKSNRRPILTDREKVYIVHQAIVQCLHFKDIAQEHRVSKGCVAILVMRAKRNPRFIDEIKAKQELRDLKWDAAKRVIDQLIEDDAFISNTEQVMNKVNEVQGVRITLTEARRFLHQMGLRYRKIHHVPLKANSDRNLILRQRWAMKVIENDHKGRVYLNIDETWLGMCDFRRQKWRVRGTNNSVPAFSLAPRVTMLVAADSLGNVYFSLSQSNSNYELFGIFMQQLVLKLDKERPNWRKNTIVTLDGAAYHRAVDTRDLFEYLEIPVAMLGPYR